MLTDTQWAMLEPLVEICHPRGKTAPQDLRPRTCAARSRPSSGGLLLRCRRRPDRRLDAN